MKRQTVCEDLEKDLILYYYGDCAVEEQERVEAHLKGCPSCSNFLTGLRTLLPLTIESEEPPQAFWESYSREMRKKLGAVKQRSAWWRSFPGFLHPWPVPAMATALVLLLAVTLTFSKGWWRSQDLPPEEEVLLEILPIVQNLEFLETIELLDSIEAIQKMERSRTQDRAV
jgi:hypothetical protein